MDVGYRVHGIRDRLVVYLILVNTSSDTSCAGWTDIRRAVNTYSAGITYDSVSTDVGDIKPLSLSLSRNDPLVGYSFRRKFMGVKEREKSSKETCPRDNKNGSDADPRQILQISSH